MVSNGSPRDTKSLFMMSRGDSFSLLPVPRHRQGTQLRITTQFFTLSHFIWQFNAVIIQFSVSLANALDTFARQKQNKFFFCSRLIRIFG